MRIYLDSMVWIYLLEGNSQFGIAAQELLKKIRAGKHTLLTSNFLLAEVLVMPVRRNDVFTIASYRRLLLADAAVEITPFTAETAMHFAELRAVHRTAPADSIHLALAASAKADVFITVDARLKKLTVPGIGCIEDLTYTLK